MFFSSHITLMLLACGIVFFTIVLQPTENRFARLVLCSTLMLTIVIYMDWRSGLVWHARPEHIHGVIWVWYFYIFEIVSFGEFAVTLIFQVAWMTDRSPQADKYERQFRGMDPRVAPPC
jgi:hypothetical protein